MKYYIITCVILLAVLSKALALDCYDDTDRKIVKCDGSCLTVTITKDDKVSKVQKRCWEQKEVEDCFVDNLMGVKTEACYCNEDGCNAGSTPSYCNEDGCNAGSTLSYCNEDGCNAGSTPSLFWLLLFMPLIIQRLQL